MSYCNKDALYLTSGECDDCSAFEARLQSLEDAVTALADANTALQESIETLQGSLNNKQNKLTAGDGIRINGNVISSITQAM